MSYCFPLLTADSYVTVDELASDVTKCVKQLLVSFQDKVSELKLDCDINIPIAVSPHVMTLLLNRVVLRNGFTMSKVDIINEFANMICIKLNKPTVKRIYIDPNTKAFDYTQHYIRHVFKTKTWETSKGSFPEERCFCMYVLYNSCGKEKFAIDNEVQPCINYA